MAIDVEIEDGIGTITIDRPERLDWGFQNRTCAAVGLPGIVASSQHAGGGRS